MLNKIKAFSLLELVLYLTLLSSVILVMVQFFLFVINKNVEGKYILERNQAVVFLQETFSYNKSVLNSIDYNNSIFDNNNGSLAFNTSSGNVSISKNNSTLTFISNSSTIPLTSPRISIDSFRLTRLVDSNGKSIGVKIVLVLHHLNISNLNPTTIEYVFTK